MAQTLRFPQKVRGNFISGDFSIPAEVSGDFSLKSPADIEDVVGRVSRIVRPFLKNMAKLSSDARMS